MKLMQRISGKLRTSIQLVLVAAMAGASAGCSMINPHVEPGPQTKQEKDAKTNACRTAAEGPTTLSIASLCADAWISTYRGALGEHATFVNSMGLAIIGVSAASLGLGVVGGQGAAITALAATGAGGIGAGYWLSSKPRQKVYAAGMAALVCAKRIMTPLALDPAASEALRNALYGDTSKEAEGLSARSMDQLIASLGVGDGLARQAREVEAKGVQLYGVLHRAGYQLLDSVGAITTEVDRLVIQTEPEWSAILDVVKGLSANYGTLSGLKPVKASQESKIALTAAQVDPKVKAELERRIAVINSYLTLFSAETLSRDYADQLEKQCQVQVSLGIGLKAADGSSVDDSNKIMIGTKAGQASYTIVGGKPYFAVELAKAVKGIKVTIEPATPRVLLVKWDDGVEELSNVVVKDATGQSATFPVGKKP